MLIALMTVAEVAEQLRKGKNFVYAEIREGRLPSIRLGRAIRIKADSLSMWLDQQQKGGGKSDK